MDKQRQAVAEQQALLPETDTLTAEANLPDSESPRNQSPQTAQTDMAHPFVTAMDGTERHFVIENEVFTIDFNNLGGRIAGIRLKDYLTYQKTDLVLFNESLSDFYLQFFANNRSVRTDRCFFDCLLLKIPPFRVMTVCRCGCASTLPFPARIKHPYPIPTATSNLYIPFTVTST